MFRLEYKKSSSGEITLPNISYHVNYIKTVFMSVHTHTHTHTHTYTHTHTHTHTDDIPTLHFSYDTPILQTSTADTCFTQSNKQIGLELNSQKLISLFSTPR